MPTSRNRKKRLIGKQRRDAKHNEEKKFEGLDEDSSAGGIPRRRSFSVIPARARSDSVSSIGAQSCVDLDTLGRDQDAGLLSSAFSWLSYGLDYVLPSRKLVRELEETKERLRMTEVQLEKEKKKKARRSLPAHAAVAFADLDGAAATGGPPSAPAAPAPPPPPPPPPPPLPPPQQPKVYVIKRGKAKRPASTSSSDSRPMVTIADLKNIKLKPAARMRTRSQSKKISQSPAPLVSLQQLQAVRLKRTHHETQDTRPTQQTCQKSPATLNFAKRLRRLDVKRSPGGTPLSLAAEHCSNKENLDMTPMLSVALRKRFSTARLHSPYASPNNSDSSFLSADFS